MLIASIVLWYSVDIINLFSHHHRDNGYIDLGEIDTGNEEPSVYIYKRMVDQLAAQMNGKIVNEHR